jgi:broad specificity phosphatase PhoE
MITRVFLCRHGETSARAQGRCHGRFDAGLSPLGKRQAVELAERLAGEELGAVYSSPLGRARETAVVVAARHELAPLELAGLSEIDFGRLEGLTYAEAERRFPEVYRRWMQEPLRVRFPGGEDYESLRRRASEALDEIRRRHPGETVAVVSHAGPLRAWLAGFLELSDPFVLELGYGSVRLVEWLGGAPTVRS